MKTRIFTERERREIEQYLKTRKPTHVIKSRLRKMVDDLILALRVLLGR